MKNSNYEHTPMSSTKWSMASKVSGILLLSLITGCASKVDCNNENAKTTVLAIAEQELNKALWYQEAKFAFSSDFSIENIKRTASNEETKSCTCNADYLFTYNGNQYKVNFDYSISLLQDKDDIEVIAYTDAIKKRIIGLLMSQPPIKNGEEVKKDPKTGNVSEINRWKNNQLHGVQEGYNPENNALIWKTNYVNGKRDGLGQQWSDDGKVLLTEVTWKDDKATGYEKKYVDGKLTVDIKVVDGLATGFVSTYSSEFNAYEEVNWKDGKKNGTEKYFTTGDNRKLILERETLYLNGEQHGTSREYYSNGQVRIETVYDRGTQISETKHPENAPIGE